MESETEEIIMLVKKPNATSIVWNYISLKANEQGMLKPGKHQTPVCRNFKKVYHPFHKLHSTFHR